MIRNDAQFMLAGLALTLLGMLIASVWHLSFAETLRLAERALAIAMLALGPSLGDEPDDGYYDDDDWLLT
jgi:hypothetical protein